MRAAFPEPVLTITPAAVRDLQGREALSGLWTLFTKCKESLQDGRRLENISWRLWYREIMRDGAPPPSSAPSPADSPNVSRIGSSERLCEEKAEKDKKKEREMNSEKGGEKHASSEKDVVVVDASHSVPSHFALFASELQQRPLSATPAPIPTPQSPPPAYALGFDFGSSKDQDDDRIPEPGSPTLASTNTVSRMNRAHPLTPSASQTSIDTDSEASQVEQDTIIPTRAPSSVLRAPSIPQPSAGSNPSSSVSAEPSIPMTHSQSRRAEKRPIFPTTSSTSSALSATSDASTSTSPNSKPRCRRSSFVNGTEEEPVNVGLIICEMLPSAGLESSDKRPTHIPFPSPSLSQSSRTPSPASSVTSSNLPNTPTLAVSISDVSQQQHGSSSSTPTATVVGLAFADLAKSAASTLPTPEIEVAEEDVLPVPPRVGGARYPLIVPSPQTSPPRPHIHQQQQQSQSGSIGGQGTPPVIPSIIAPGGVQPPQLVIVTPTPGATPHPTPPATPLVGGIGRMYNQYLIVPKSGGQGRSRTKGGDGEREDDDEGSTDEDEDGDGSEDYTDSEDGDYEDVDDEEDKVPETTKAALIPDVPVAVRSEASPLPSHTGLMYSTIAGGDSEKRVSISSTISDRSTTSNTSSNTTNTTSSAETRDTEASLQPAELKRDKGKQKELASPDDEWEEDENEDEEYGELDDEDAIVEDFKAKYERRLQQSAMPPEQEHEPTAIGSGGASSLATMKAEITKPGLHSPSTLQQDQPEQQHPQVQSSPTHAKRRSPTIAARSAKGLRGGFTAGKGKSSSRSRSRSRDEALKLASALVMTASATIVSSPPQEPECSAPVAVEKSSPVVPTPAPVVALQSAKAPPPARLPTVSAAVVPPGAQVAFSPPPPSPTYSIQSTSSSGRGRSRNVVAIGRGVGSNGGKGKRRGGQLASLKRRSSGDGRKGGSSPKTDNGEEEEEEEAAEEGEMPDKEKGEKETSIEMDADDMLDEEVNPQAKVEQAELAAAIQQQSSDTSKQPTVGPIDPAQVQAHIKAQIQAGEPPQTEPVPTAEHRAPVRFNIGSNSEDGTGSASASGSASVGRSGSTGFRSGSGSGSRSRGGMVLKRRLEKARARAVSRSVEEEKETAEEYGRKSGETGGHAETHEVAASQQAQVQPAEAQSAPRVLQSEQPTQPVVRPLLQPMGNRKGDRQLEELLKMEQRTHQLASRQVSTVAVGGGLPPVIAPLSPSPRPNARSPSQGRGKSPRTKSAIAQRANTSRSTGSTSKNLQDPQLMKVLNHVMDLPSNANRQKKVVLATSESEEDDDEDYETETDVDSAGLVAALSPLQQQAFADQMAAARAAPEAVPDQQQNDDEDQWSSATDELDDDVSPPNQARPQVSLTRQRSSQQPPVRPPAVQRTYSSHYPAGRTGRAVKQQLAEQQRQQQQQQQQQNLRRGKSQRDSIEINRLPSESFQNLALAKLRNNSIGGLTRLLNPGLNEQELLSTVQRGYSSGDILRDHPTPIRRVPTGGIIGGMHGLRPLTSAHPSLARMPLMQPPLAPMAAPLPNWNQVADPRVQEIVPHQDQKYMVGRPPLVRRHTEHGSGPAAVAVQPVETCIPAPSVAPTEVVPAPVISDVPKVTQVPPAPVAAPTVSKTRSVTAPGGQPHRRQSSSSSTATALRPNGLLTKLTLNKSFIAPASTTVSVNSLASDRASPADINPKSGNSLYSKVPPDATSRIRALNALVNSRKTTPVAKSPPVASPIATSSSAPADAVIAAAALQQSPLSPSPAPPAPATIHESVTAPNGANVTAGLDGYGGAGRYQKRGPPADVELETEEEDEDGMYEDESSDRSDSVAEGTFQTERQKQIAASLACSLSADPVLDDPVPSKPPANSKGKGDKLPTQERVRKAPQAQVQRSAGKIGTGGRRAGKSAERVRGVRDSSAHVAAGFAEPKAAQQQVAPTEGVVTNGEGSQQRKLPKTLQFAQIAPLEQAPSRQVSRQALQQEQNQQHHVQYAQDRTLGHPQPPQPGPQQPFPQQQEYMQLQQQQQLQWQLHQLEQQQIQQQRLLEQQQLQYQQQQQLLQLQNVQQQFAYQPQGQGQFGYPHQQHPQHPPHFYPQGGPSNHPSYAPIPYTQSQQHFPTASLQKLGFPYNLPVTAIPSTPRTTRRTMVKDELSESVRQGVVMGRKITKLNQGLQTGTGEDAEWRRRPLTAAPSMVQLLPKGTLRAMGMEDDEPGASKRRGAVAEPDPAMRRALQHSRNKSWADTTHTSGW